ncbi:MAG: 4-hydroxythreonine-4-phosphate dehydrogenase PdxA [Bryobacterales bacterium]|nr:4-hydroxythreonine-4-phosphate dehydrogenase PdxA [Bryobacterales bacterium]
MKPTVALTMGDPAGIGPEIVLKALADESLRALANWIVVGDRKPLEMIDAAGLDALASEAGMAWQDPGAIEGEDFAFGRSDARCGKAGLEYVRLATLLCLEGKAQAMVTAPLNKEAVAMSGIPFTGHTEFIAELCGSSESRMLLINDHLRVAHVTTHVSLRRACELQPERILRTIELATDAVRLIGYADPRVAVCGLNPHAGEHGLFGTEDEQFIAPAVEQAKAKGIRCEGPIPGDTVFLKAARGGYDLVIAMYHDQGHIPIKLLDFEHTINVSIGIPIIRTSVDHGTAFDIAGRGIADAGSMKAAMRLAARMGSNRLSHM